MSASKKAKAGVIIGIVICTCGAVVAAYSSYRETGEAVVLLSILLGPLLGAFYGFGFPFGWPLAKKWCARLCGVSAAGSFLLILFSKDRRNGFLAALVLTVLAFSTALGLCYIPGIFIGIKEIRAERQLQV